MKQRPTPVSSALPARVPRVISLSLLGPRPLVWLLRMAWPVATGMTLVHVIAGLPYLFARFQRVCASCLLQPADVGVLQALRLSTGHIASALVALAALFALVYLGVGALIFRRRPDDRMALVTALALVTLGGTAFGDPADALTSASAPWQAIVTVLFFVGRATLFLLVFLFPDGQFVPRWTAVPAALAIVLVALVTVLPNLPLIQWLTLPGGVFLFAGIGASAVLAQVYRYRRVSNREQRQQTKWVVFGIAFALAAQIGEFVALDTLHGSGPHVLVLLLGNLLVALAFMLIPLSLALAILRHRLWAIDFLINRTLVYVALSACIAGLYGLAVGTLSAVFRVQGNVAISLAATGLVAVLFQPARERLQRGVNRLFYGQRDEPYAVVSQLGRRLEAALTPDVVLSTLVETVAQALKLPYAALAVLEGPELTTLVAYGAPRGEPLVLPLIYQTEAVGELRLCPRVPGEPWTPADRHLLDELARQAGTAVKAARLTADLQQSRERLVTAREEERRRLRRDLHDGLGPALATLAAKAEAAREMVRADPGQAEALLDGAIVQAQAAIADIRQLVYDLRPPALDDLGLVGAIRAQVTHYEGVSSSPLRVVVEAPDPLPALSAAAEVATYRIVQEALTNVVRHAHAQTCSIRLALHGSVLHVEVRDDGCGIPADRCAGVGLNSLRERAAELGGTCRIHRVSAGTGTRVLAMLPCRGVSPPAPPAL